MTSQPRITEIDVRRLVRSEADDDRAAAAHKLCRHMERSDLSDIDRAAAQKIIRVLSEDAAEMVRRALAVTLKSSDLVPPDVARRLAADADSIAIPMISSSPVFSDDDLIEILRAGQASRQIAVAGRSRVSRDVAEVVADEGCELAVRTLAANDNADIAESGLNRIVDRYGEKPEVNAALAYRAVLPLSVTERLVELASDAVREHLIQRHALAPQTAIRLARYARERSTIDLVDQAESSKDISEFVANLAARKVLSGSLLLRALSRGSMTFFEYGLAELAGTPHQRAWLMIHDGGPLGLKAIYDRAGLPARLYGAFRAGVDTWRQLQDEGGALDRARFQQRMLERFLTQRPNAPREDIAYLMERLDQAPERDQPAAANAA